VATVRIEDAPRMNILGLFLAAGLKRNLVTRGRPCRLRGGLTVDAEGMRATVVFGPDGAVVTRAETPARVVLRAPLAAFVAALARPRLRRLLRIGVRGNPLFALRAMRYLRP
jgi:hypothetical protein